MKNLVIGMGEALWDILPTGKKLGGAPANFAYIAEQFGMESVVVSAVGDDALGHEIIDSFDEKKLAADVAVVDRPTGTVDVVVDCNGVPQYEIRENVAWDHIPFTPGLQRMASEARAVCFGSLAQRNAVSRSTIHRVLDAMPKDGDTLIVFDINLRQHFYSREIIEESLRRCNVLKLNDEELEIVTPMLEIQGRTGERRCRELIARYGLRMVILTCGIDGSYVFTPEGMSFLPTPLVEVVDTVGAGDSFTGSFIASIIKGKGVAEAHRIAVETSAYVCTCAGAMPPLPASLTR